MYFISMMASISFKMLAMRSIPQFFRYFTKELIPILYIVVYGIRVTLFRGCVNKNIIKRRTKIWRGHPAVSDALS